MDASSLFLSHGAPTIALEPGEYGRSLSRAGGELAPKAILVFSAHFPSRSGIRITAAPRPPLIYDFSGFPEELYRMTYPAPGSPELAGEVRGLLEAAGVPADLDSSRGWDHGLWVPLRLAFPNAAIPVVEASLPLDRGPKELLALGGLLAPLQGRGVLVVGSGGIVHNLERVRFGADDVDGWAREFDGWVAERLEKGEIDELAEYRRLARHADLAVPTPEHFDPLFVALGYAGPNARVVPLYRGFEHGNIALSSYRFEG